MNTSYELLQAAKGFAKGRKECFEEIYKYTVDDIFYQTYFLTCDMEMAASLMREIYQTIISHIRYIDNMDNVSMWINQVVINKTHLWLKNRRADMYEAERKGIYKLPLNNDAVTGSRELEDAEYTSILEKLICKLPEIYRHTALAHYYDNCPIEVVADEMCMDNHVIKERTNYIKRVLGNEMVAVCAKEGYKLRNVNSQRIVSALNELSKKYKYRQREELFATITY